MIYQIFCLLACATSLGMAAPIADGFDYSHKYPPTPYRFNYHVEDLYKGTDYAHRQNSDGKSVYGSYTVALPDGRQQTVEYTADHHRGFIAKVSYQGKARHPKHHGSIVSYNQPLYHK